VGNDRTNDGAKGDLLQERLKTNLSVDHWSLDGCPKFKGQMTSDQ
jgi:hypothetical protein